MLYYLDSARTDLVAAALKKYPIDGITTNPTILARDIEDGMTLSELLYELRKLTDGKKLFVQVTAEDVEGMVRDAEKIVSALGGDITVKVPSTPDGFEAIKVLKSSGISTAATACYSTSQALLTSKAGADFVAPYISHLDNLSLDGPGIAAEMARQLVYHNLDTQILAASFRTASQIERCIAGGVGAVTVTADMLCILSSHPGTDKELSAFRQNWNMRFEKNISELL